MKRLEAGSEAPTQENRKEQPPQEIERKFLIRSLPENLEEYPHEDITQGYIVITEDGTEVRLRKKGDKYFQTVKSGGGKTRAESEIEITEQQFNVLWHATEGKRLEKTRYKIPDEAGLIELDVYRGNLQGLVTAEIEFDSEEASEKFAAPAWFGREATEDKRYKNQNLALRGIPKEEKVRTGKNRRVVIGLDK